MSQSARGLENLVVYKEIHLGKYVITPEYIEGDVTVDNDQSKSATCSFTFRNVDDAQVVSTLKGARAMIGMPVKVIAGYMTPNGSSLRTMFKGVVTTVGGVGMTESGTPTIQISCMSYGYGMSTIVRNEVYPIIKREKTPSRTDKGEQVRTEISADNRSWAQRGAKGTLSLSEVIRGVVDLYKADGIKIGKIDVDDVVFNGKDKTLHQKDMSDWKFLQELAYTYDCNMDIDAETDEFIFIQNRKLSEQKTTVNGVEAKDLSFWIHKPGRPMADVDKIDPTSPSCELPVDPGWSYSFDAPSVQGGFVTTSTDIFGNEILSGYFTNEKGETVYQRLVLDESKLDSDEATNYLKKAVTSGVTWEDTKKFWMSKGMEVADYSANRTNPPFYDYNPNLEFTVPGCIYIQTMKHYTVHNLQMHIDVNTEDAVRAMCIGTTHSFGEEFKTTVRMYYL